MRFSQYISIFFISLCNQIESVTISCFGIKPLKLNVDKLADLLHEKHLWTKMFFGPNLLQYPFVGDEKLGFSKFTIYSNDQAVLKHINNHNLPATENNDNPILEEYTYDLEIDSIYAVFKLQNRRERKLELVTDDQNPGKFVIISSNTEEKQFNGSVYAFALVYVANDEGFFIFQQCIMDNVAYYNQVWVEVNQNIVNNHEFEKNDAYKKEINDFIDNMNNSIHKMMRQEINENVLPFWPFDYEISKEGSHLRKTYSYRFKF